MKSLETRSAVECHGNLPSPHTNKLVNLEYKMKKKTYLSTLYL